MNTKQSAAELWDTELFVLEGADRDALLQRIREFKSHISQQPNVSLFDLAVATNAQLSSEKRVRVGMVADSYDQLLRHLDRALEKIANPKCCLLYTSPSPRDQRGSRMPSSA